MPPCPHCGRPVPDGAAHCPNCGAQVKAISLPTPPPAGEAGYGLGMGCLLSVALYSVLGAVAFMDNLKRKYPRMYPTVHPLPVFRDGTWPINLAPLALIGVLYLTLRPRHPAFARGLGYCLVVILGLLLYGLATCRN